MMRTPGRQEQASLKAQASNALRESVHWDSWNSELVPSRSLQQIS